MAYQKHADLREKVPAFALGSLDKDEADQLARHLETCPTCADELNGYERVVDSLALAAPEVSLSPSVRERLVAEVGGRPTRVAAARSARSAPRRIEPRRAWPALAVLALAVIILGGLVWAAAGGLVVDGRTIPLDPTEFAPAASGQLRFSRDGRAATLEVEGLPPLPVGQQYQLWLANDDVRDSGALFLVDATGWAEVPVTVARRAAEYERFGITIEPAGGSPGPTGERVLGGEY